MMRKRPVILGAVAVAALAIFFLLPAVYWFSSGPGVNEPNPPRWNMYRSLSCLTLGIGDTYNQSPHYGGLRLTCTAPPIPNGTA
jgi:hypothetical protein